LRFATAARPYSSGLTEQPVGPRQAPVWMRAWSALAGAAPRAVPASAGRWPAPGAPGTGWTAWTRAQVRPAQLQARPRAARWPANGPHSPRWLRPALALRRVLMRLARWQFLAPCPRRVRVQKARRSGCRTAKPDRFGALAPPADDAGCPRPRRGDSRRPPAGRGPGRRVPDFLDGQRSARRTPRLPAHGQAGPVAARSSRRRAAEGSAGQSSMPQTWAQGRPACSRRRGEFRRPGCRERCPAACGPVPPA